MIHWAAALPHPRNRFDLALYLDAALRQAGYAPERSGFSVVVERLLVESDFMSTEMIGEHHQVVLLMAANANAFTQPLGEIQVGIGKTVGAAVASAYERWIETDFLALLDATREMPKHCTTMSHVRAATDPLGPSERRTFFGPVEQTRSTSPEPPATDGDHAFCPCCLTTRGLVHIDYARELRDSDRTLGIKLFAARNPDGSFSADCRINMAEHREGVESLSRYAGSWPGTGLEWRKQYVVMHTVRTSH